jgi:hypothetical protein
VHDYIRGLNAELVVTRLASSVQSQVIFGVLDLGTTEATVADWHTQAFAPRCAWRPFDFYVRDVDFSPDGSYVAAATSGFRDTTVPVHYCDALVRFEANATGNVIHSRAFQRKGEVITWAMLPPNSWLDRLLGLCFCDHCLGSAEAGGIDTRQLQNGVRAQIDRYLGGLVDMASEMAEAWWLADLVASDTLTRFLRWRCGVVTKRRTPKATRRPAHLSGIRRVHSITRACQRRGA